MVAKLFNIGNSFNPEFLMGHEVGHKISKYKLDDETRVEIRNIFGLSSMNKYIIEETFADACGDIVENSQNSNYYQFLPNDPIKREYMRTIALRTSNKC